MAGITMSTWANVKVIFLDWKSSSQRSSSLQVSVLQIHEKRKHAHVNKPARGTVKEIKLKHNPFFIVSLHWCMHAAWQLSHVTEFNMYVHPVPSIEWSAGWFLRLWFQLWFCLPKILKTTLFGPKLGYMSVTDNARDLGFEGGILRFLHVRGIRCKKRSLVNDGNAAYSDPHQVEKCTFVSSYEICH